MASRFVLDTNVVISALIWRGIPAKALTAATLNQVNLFTSQALVNELSQKLKTPKLVKAMQAREVDADELIALYLALCELIPVQALTTPVCRDPDDDWVLATALAANATVIVSGDQDLLVLHPYKDIDILRPADVARKLEESFG